VRVDFPEVVARRDAIVRSFREGKERQAAGRKGLHLYRGPARFASPHAVAAGDDTVESDRIFINTGTRPAVPPIPGLETIPYLTNLSVLDMTVVPAHLIVLGGGYIGLEYGQIFRRLGSEVTVVHTGDQILSREDRDVAAALRHSLEAEGIRFLLGRRTARVAQASGGVALTLESRGGSSVVSGSHLFVATGRAPNTDALALDKAGVLTEDRGYVRVNERLETTVPGIWALGDVKGGPAFTHLSYDDYLIVAANLLEGGSRTTDGRLVPYALFTDPQLGRIGLTEKEARASGRTLKVGIMPMTSVARAIERGEAAGFMKLVVDAATDRVLGAAVLGAEGGELVHVFETLMLADAPYTLLKRAIYIHPTLAEGFFGLMEDVRPLEDRAPAAA
jgi:pyruvate/2-oxoglutarate dehydrogenase complex dihydrolipoamide dehydrogenase (E3) component